MDIRYLEFPSTAECAGRLRFERFYRNNLVHDRPQRYRAVMKAQGIAALALAGLLSGCGSGSSGSSAPKPITKQQYISGLHDQGLTNADASNIDKMVSTVKSGDCGQSDSQLKINAALIMDNGPAMLKVTRLTMLYACPQTVAVWDHAVAEVNALN